ncbi:pseudouridine synthase [Persicobacter sp. CCB-QB2]|uniref:pseudouridine synthase n=1 Tax=Persicobacter sp. CCB-QB2 TaxID=1561025 RepID=UPI00092E3DF4
MKDEQYYYYLIYKPFNTLTQFKGEGDTLADLYDFPKDVYPVGRLDKDSEGLLILTNDKAINHQLLHPKFKHKKEYWVQVEGEITEDALKQLRAGVTINVEKKDHFTAPAWAKRIAEPPLEKRNPPIRERKNIPTSWISLTITEGKNRQVRKMVASVGFPCLRLVRAGIEELKVEGMKIGEVKKIAQDRLYESVFGDRKYQPKARLQKAEKRFSTDVLKPKSGIKKLGKRNFKRPEGEESRPNKPTSNNKPNRFKSGKSNKR